MLLVMEVLFVISVEMVMQIQETVADLHAMKDLYYVEVLEESVNSEVVWQYGLATPLLVNPVSNYILYYSK